MAGLIFTVSFEGFPLARIAKHQAGHEIVEEAPQLAEFFFPTLASLLPFLLVPTCMHADALACHECFCMHAHTYNTTIQALPYLT